MQESICSFSASACKTSESWIPPSDVQMPPCQTWEHRKCLLHLHPVCLVPSPRVSPGFPLLHAPSSATLHVAHGIFYTLSLNVLHIRPTTEHMKWPQAPARQQHPIDNSVLKRNPSPAVCQRHLDHTAALRLLLAGTALPGCCQCHPAGSVLLSAHWDAQGIMCSPGQSCSTFTCRALVLGRLERAVQPLLGNTHT